jgi:Fe-S-cluster-containing hydrogenase component 2
MDIDVDASDVVTDQLCTMCTQCVDACPSPGALRISTGAAAEAFRPVAVGAATTALFFALIGTGMAMGWWETGAGCAGCSASAEITESKLSPPSDYPHGLASLE